MSESTVKPPLKVTKRNAKGQIMATNRANIITPETARDMVMRKMERKRQAIQEAANSAVQRGDFTAAYGDMAYIAEIGYAAQLKATNIDDPKMIDAARFLLKETGLSETSEDAAHVPAQAAVNEVLLRIAAAAVDVLSQRRDTVPVTVIDAPQSNSDND